MIRYRVQSFFSQVTPLTWGLWLLLVADIAEPGHLRFNFVVLTVDASAISVEISEVWDAVKN